MFKQLVNFNKKLKKNLQILIFFCIEHKNEVNMKLVTISDIMSKKIDHNRTRRKSNGYNRFVRKT
jgi:hypothetical protein